MQTESPRKRRITPVLAACIAVIVVLAGALGYSFVTSSAAISTQSSSVSSLVVLSGQMQGQILAL